MRSQRGFTLIELLVAGALGLFLLILMGVGVMLIYRLAVGS